MLVLFYLQSIKNRSSEVGVAVEGGEVRIDSLQLRDQDALQQVVEQTSVVTLFAVINLDVLVVEILQLPKVRHWFI